MPVIEVVLTVEQHLYAARIGFARRENALRRGFTPRHSGVASFWGGDLEGACAEYAVALLLGLPWTASEGFGAGIGLPPRERQPDVGTCTEVRWAERKPLLNFDSRHDHDDRRYVLVTGFAPTFAVLGWIEGRDCRDDRYRIVYPERVLYRVPTDARGFHHFRRRTELAA